MADRKDVLVVAAVALLAVTSIGLVAATIDTTYTSTVPGMEPGEGIVGDDEIENGEQGQTPDQNGVPPGEGQQSPLEIPQWCVPFLTTWQGGLLLAGAVLGLTGVAFLKFGFVVGAFVGYFVGIPAIIAYGLLTQCPETGETQDEAQSALVEYLGDAAAAGGLVATDVPPELLVVVVGLAMVIGVAAVYFASGSEELTPPEPGDEIDPDLEAFAAAAGRAADRIEATDAGIDNAVYRAWAEMTSMLSIPNQDTAAPAEFAEAAIEAGMEEDDVTQLTTLFQEVRYGELDPEPREELAVETLRQIERTYGSAADAKEEQWE